MTKTVVDCGNCAPDHSAIRNMLQSNFDVEIVQTHGADDTLQVLRSREVALVTVNRKLDKDYSDGTVVIEQIKADPALADVPVMLVTNYEEHQDAAEKLGAVRGFGKLSLHNDETIERLRPYLS